LIGEQTHAGGTRADGRKKIRFFPPIVSALAPFRGAVPRKVKRKRTHVSYVS
jgi:hypothetical protein